MLLDLYSKIMNQTASVSDYNDFLALLLVQTIGGVLLTPEEALLQVKEQYLASKSS